MLAAIPRISSSISDGSSRSETCVFDDHCVPPDAVSTSAHCTSTFSPTRFMDHERTSLAPKALAICTAGALEALKANEVIGAITRISATCASPAIRSSAQPSAITASEVSPGVVAGRMRSEYRAGAKLL